MKIIHTADWHIGKMLYKNSINDELQMFFDWLLDLIKEQKIDVLLVAGDIFDLANPSHSDLKIYYQFLRKLMAVDIQVIITGGNHDSVSLLNAPKDILSTLNIHVVGGATDNIEDELILIHSPRGNMEAVVLAVPFLRDRDLRVSVQADIDLDREAILPTAIKKHYDALVGLAQEKYGKERPLLAMGHLFVQGAETSDSERDIHVGHLLGIHKDVFHESIQYMALGHIHKPQRIGHNHHIRYSGSPVYLDFSEENYSKGVVMIELNNNKVESIQVVKIPLFRQLKRISGSLESTKNELMAFEKTSLLPSFVELTIQIDYRDPAILLEIDNWVHQKNEHYKIIKHVVKVQSSVIGNTGRGAENVTIEDLTPLDVLERRCENESIDTDLMNKIKEVYCYIVEDLQ